jgi:hypothetical protein
MNPFDDGPSSILIFHALSIISQGGVREIEIFAATSPDANNVGSLSRSAWGKAKARTTRKKSREKFVASKADTEPKGCA